MSSDNAPQQARASDPPINTDLQEPIHSVVFTFPVGAHVPYHVPSLTLHGRSHEVEAELKAGSGDLVFTSRVFDLGVIHCLGEATLLGQLAFTYQFDAVERTITVCSTEFSSSAGMSLTTMPQDSTHFCIERAAHASGFLEDDVSRSGVWNYRTPMTPGADAVFKSIVRAANEAMISALEGVPGIRVAQRIPLLDLPPQLYFDLTSVRREGTVIASYHPSTVYEPGWSITGLGSQFDKKGSITAPTDFANVIGSKKDPKVKSMTWITLWETCFGQRPTVCSSQGYPAGFSCGGIILGGHVILSQTPAVVAPGSDNVLIIPICHNHNMKYDSYMQLPAGKTVNVVYLKNYMQ
jgi:hypothetical protein